jgi:hypothetical protein
MPTTVITGFFGRRADAAHAYEAIVRERVQPEEISVIHHDPPGIEAFGIRHPADRGVEASSDAITARLERPGTLVLADLGISIAGPIVESITEASPGEGESAVTAGLARAGVSAYEAQYVEQAVRRGGTVLVVRADEDQVPAVRELFEGAGGRRLHAVHEELPVLRA